MNSLLQAFSDYTGIAIEYDCSVQSAGKKDVHTAASFVPSAATPSGATPSAATDSAATPSEATPSGATPSGATNTEPSKTDEASTNTEPATLELRIQSLEEQVKLLLARLAILEQPK